jgi:hypothetical protein
LFSSEQKHDGNKDAPEKKGGEEEMHEGVGDKLKHWLGFGHQDPILADVQKLSPVAHQFAKDIVQPNSHIALNGSVHDVFVEKANSVVPENSPAIEKEYKAVVEPAVHQRQKDAEQYCINVARALVKEAMNNAGSRRNASEIEASFWEACERHSGVGRAEDPYAQNAFSNKHGLVLSLEAALEKAREAEAESGESEVEEAPAQKGHAPRPETKKPQQKKPQAGPPVQDMAAQIRNLDESGDPSDEFIDDSTSVHHHDKQRRRHH